MKLENLNLVELNASELKVLDGGWRICGIVGRVVDILEAIYVIDQVCTDLKTGWKSGNCSNVCK